MLRLGETRHGSTTGGNPVAHLRSRSGESRPHGSRYRNADDGRDRPRGGIWSRGSFRDPRCTCSKRMKRFHWRGSRLRSGADSCAAGSAPVSNGTFRTPWRSLHSQGSRVPSGTFGNELLTGYRQPVNNLLITSIIAQNDQKRASKNRTTTTSAQTRKRYCSEKGPQGSLFFPLNPYFSYLYFCDKYYSYTCEKK